MKISIIIPIFNAENTLEQCLQSIASQSLKAYQIILVDNNSTDNSYIIAENFKNNNQKLKVVLTKEDKKGPSAARNKGISLAEGDIVAFMDSDCIAHPDWLKNLVQAYKDDSIAAVSGNIKGFKPKGSIQKFLSLFTMRGLPKGKLFKQFNLISGGFPTANFSSRLSVLKEINGFDNNMIIYSEDFDLCARIYKKGYIIAYTPQALIYHIHRSNLKGLIKQSFGFGRGHSILLKKHFKQIFLFEIPKYNLETKKFPVKAWINLVTIDKKILFFVILGILFWPLFAILLFYLLYLYWDINHRLKKEGISAGIGEKWVILSLLLVKSLALTGGRIFGSIRYGTVCI